MDFNTVLELDYETQYFGFHPRVFIDGIYNVFYENIFEALNHMQKYLCDEIGDVSSPEAIKSNTDALFQKLVKMLDTVIDKLETFANINVLSIPNNVVLPEDKVHITHQFTEEDEQTLDKEIEELIQEIIKEKVQKSVIKNKMAEQKLMKEELVYLQEKFQDLSSLIHQGIFTKDALNVAVEKCREICDRIKQYEEKKRPSS